MFDLKLEDNKIKNIVFCRNFEPFTQKGWPYSHTELADYFRCYELLNLKSVIIIAKRMCEDLYDDPKHCVKTNHLCVSEVREEARRRLQNKYYSEEELDALAKKYNLHFWKTNDPEYMKKEGERDFKFQVQDAMFRTQEELLFPEIIDYFTYHTKYQLDEFGCPLTDNEGNEILLNDPELVDERYRNELERIFMPQVRTSYERRALMPTPFDWWDWRNSFQQYFFVARLNRLVTIKEERNLSNQKWGIHYCIGGSGSSGQREIQGRMSHTFATMAEKYGIEAETFYCQYTDRNELVYLGKSDTFKAMNRELSGNYQSPRETVKSLFKNRCVCITGECDGIDEVTNENNKEIW